MRVYMVTGDDLARFGGGTIHLMEQAENLLALGHRVEIFAQGRGQPYPGATPVPIHYLPAPGRGAGRVLIYNLSLLLALLWRCLARRPDVIHTRQMGYSATPLLLAGLLRLPHVLEVNGVLRDELAGQHPARLRLALIDFCARLNLRRSDAFTTTTAEYLQRLHQLYGAEPRRAAPMPCGVNPERFRPGDRAQARVRLGLDPEVFALLHVGSLYDWRGLDVLLGALARIDRGRDGGMPRWQLWLVGDGVERPRLEEQSRRLGIADRVRFVGQVPYPQVPDWLVAADVGVVLYKPTRPVPGDPMKVYEYMACALPVLAGDHPHYGGVVVPAGAGVAVDDGNPDALATAIAALAADPETRRLYGDRGARAAAEHTWARRAQQLAALLQAVADGRFPSAAPGGAARGGAT